MTIVRGRWKLNFLQYTVTSEAQKKPSRIAAFDLAVYIFLGTRKAEHASPEALSYAKADSQSRSLHILLVNTRPLSIGLTRNLMSV